MTAKLCKDCKWVKDPGEFAKCTCPALMQNVTGYENTPQIGYCEIQRDAGWFWSLIAPGGRCGKAGHYFEPRAI
jgi:hypothetical protein